VAKDVVGLRHIGQPKGSPPVGADTGADRRADYTAAGFDTFDMADHSGSAEILTGRLLARGVRAQAFTKWCPAPGPMTAHVVRAGVRERLQRLDVDRVDLLQFHWWTPPLPTPGPFPATAATNTASRRS